MVPRRPSKILPSIRVANETDQMYPQTTWNPSGQDAWGADFIAQNCSSTSGVFKYFILSACVFLQNINGLRAGALLGGAFTPEIFSSASGRPATCRSWFQARRHSPIRWLLKRPSTWIPSWRLRLLL